MKKICIVTRQMCWGFNLVNILNHMRKRGSIHNSRKNVAITAILAKYAGVNNLTIKSREVLCYSGEIH